MKTLKVAVMAIALASGLSGCGHIQGMETAVGGHTKVCVDHATYIIFNTGAVEQRDITTDKLVPC